MRHDTTTNKAADETIGRFRTIAKDLREAADKVDTLAGPASEIPCMPPSDTGTLRDDLRDLAHGVQAIGGRLVAEAGAKGRESD